MASSKPSASSSAAVPSPEESSVVRVLDSNEPLVSNSSPVHLLPRVQSNEPIAGCSTTADVAPDGLTEFSDEDSAQPQQSGSSGRRIHLYSEEVRLQWN
ncbi:hypothetical protein evm_013994 [Chilo suppressalis]|nr:hypothetical protein evm_013994 [Chilo suppressalis]